MNKQLSTKLVILSGLCVLGLAPVARAGQETTGHFTNFLDALQVEVSNQLATAELTTDQSNALVSAQDTLNGNSSTLFGDLRQFQQASATLDNAFSNNVPLITAEDDILLLFAGAFDERVAQLNTTLELFNNRIPRPVTARINQANRAIATFQDTNSTFNERTEALGQALNSVEAAITLSERYFRAPPTLENKSVLITTGRGRNRQRQTLSPADFGQDTVGGWTYVRVTGNTGTITVHGDQTDTDYHLTFTTRRAGRVTSDVGNGSFRILILRGGQ